MLSGFFVQSKVFTDETEAATSRIHWHISMRPNLYIVEHSQCYFLRFRGFRLFSQQQEGNVFDPETAFIVTRFYLLPYNPFGIKSSNLFGPLFHGNKALLTALLSA